MSGAHASYAFDENIRKDFAVIAGVDEAGRGPLAGPVVAAAVILPPDAPPIIDLRDSKTVPFERREALFGDIQRVAVAIGIAIVPPEVIDHINILQATLLAMR